ncbi:MAG: pyridoxal phosphate-dependent decarboxylase family protein [Acidimicrobiales bacterium]
MSDDVVPGMLASRDALLAAAAARARAYLANIGERRVPPTAEAVAALDGFDAPLPEHGFDPHRTLALLDDVGSPATVATTGPRYFGFVNGGALPMAVATSWLLAAWDQNAALQVMSPVAARLEAIALDWLTELFGLPTGATGGFVTGATMANATCLAAARDSVLAATGWDAARFGLVGAPPIEVVTSAESHTTVDKALGLIGLGRGRATRLGVDDEGRVRPTALPSLRKPAIVCLQAGNVNSGASDPFFPLVEWAHGEGAWIHVDGAFGLWAASSPKLSAQVAGVEGADSWATDAHKWLNTTYDCGIALVRDPDALHSSMRAQAAYLVAEAAHETMEFTPQSSQRARGAEAWAVLATLGRAGVASLVERSCALARRFADGLATSGVKVLNDVVLNQVVVDFGHPDRTNAVIAAVQAEGTCWCGPTTWQGRRAMRISISCWATTEDDVDRSVASVVRSAAR